MNTGTADRRSLQFYRIENCDRIDQSCPGRTPFDFPQYRFPNLVCPFKGKGISREFCCAPKRISISNIIIECNQTIRRKIIVLNCMRKIIHCFIQRLARDHPIFYHLKSLRFKPLHLISSGIMHINILRRHQRESIKSYISPGCDLIIQLSD